MESRRQLLQQSNVLRAESQKAKAPVEALKTDASKVQGEAAGLKVGETHGAGGEGEGRG